MAHAGPDRLERGPPLSSSPRSPQQLARELAPIVTSGPWRPADVIERAGLVLGRRPRWLKPVVGRLFEALGTGARPTAGRVAGVLKRDAGWIRAFERTPLAVDVRRAAPPAMWPAQGGPSSWIVPSILTPGELADFLDVGQAELMWLADPHGRERRSKLDDPRRYDYRWIAKRSGSSRLVEVPRPRLRIVQRKVLRGILNAIPPHEAAHGFRRGRSVRTYVAPHVGRSAVLKLDLVDFFPAITSARVTATFLACGYPEPVARLLSGLCTNGAPSWVWSRPGAPPAGLEMLRARERYRQPHTPQGAPTSPSLANLCAYRLDARLSGLASASGAAYTRYADDLAFSGDAAFSRSVDRVHVHACAIAIEEGFLPNTRKTRIMRRGVRQSLAGVVVNEKTSIPRREFDALKATLHNCARLGPASQNRVGAADFRSHLLGRITHVTSLHPERGRALRATYDRIAW